MLHNLKIKAYMTIINPWTKNENDPDDIIIEAPVESTAPEADETKADSDTPTPDRTDTPCDADNDTEPLYSLASDDEIEEIQRMVESDIECGLHEESEHEAEEPVAPATTAVNLTGIQEKLDELTQMFEQKIAQDTHKAQLFDKMYAELQSYRADIYAKLLKPFILSTITVIDDTNGFIARLGENDSAKAEAYLRGIPDDLADILDQNGVDIYQDDTEVFNPRTQKAMKNVPTDDPELNKHIAKCLRPGYRWNGTILKPELVQIYKYEEKKQ